MESLNNDTEVEKLNTVSENVLDFFNNNFDNENNDFEVENVVSEHRATSDIRLDTNRNLTMEKVNAELENEWNETEIELKRPIGESGTEKEFFDEKNFNDESRSEESKIVKITNLNDDSGLEKAVLDVENVSDKNGFLKTDTEGDTNIVSESENSSVESEEKENINFHFIYNGAYRLSLKRTLDPLARIFCEFIMELTSQHAPDIRWFDPTADILARNKIHLNQVLINSINASSTLLVFGSHAPTFGVKTLCQMLYTNLHVNRQLQRLIRVQVGIEDPLIPEYFRLLDTLRFSEHGPSAWMSKYEAPTLVHLLAELWHEESHIVAEKLGLSIYYNNNERMASPMKSYMEQLMTHFTDELVEKNSAVSHLLNQMIQSSENFNFCITNHLSSRIVLSFVTRFRVNQDDAEFLIKQFAVASERRDNISTVCHTLARECALPKTALHLLGLSSNSSRNDETSKELYMAFCDDCPGAPSLYLEHWQLLKERLCSSGWPIILNLSENDDGLNRIIKLTPCQDSSTAIHAQLMTFCQTLLNEIYSGALTKVFKSLECPRLKEAPWIMGVNLAAIGCDSKGSPVLAVEKPTRLENMWNLVVWRRQVKNGHWKCYSAALKLKSHFRNEMIDAVDVLTIEMQWQPCFKEFVLLRVLVKSKMNVKEKNSINEENEDFENDNLLLKKQDLSTNVEGFIVRVSLKRKGTIDSKSPRLHFKSSKDIGTYFCRASGLVWLPDCTCTSLPKKENKEEMIHKSEDNNINDSNQVSLNVEPDEPFDEQHDEQHDEQRDEQHDEPHDEQHDNDKLHDKDAETAHDSSKINEMLLDKEPIAENDETLAVNHKINELTLKSENDENIVDAGQSNCISLILTHLSFSDLTLADNWLWKIDKNDLVQEVPSLASKDRLDDLIVEHVASNAVYLAFLVRSNAPCVRAIAILSQSDRQLLKWLDCCSHFNNTQETIKIYFLNDESVEKNHKWQLIAFAPDLAQFLLFRLTNNEVYDLNIFSCERMFKNLQFDGLSTCPLLLSSGKDVWCWESYTIEQSGILLYPVLSMIHRGQGSLLMENKELYDLLLKASTINKTLYYKDDND